MNERDKRDRMVSLRFSPEEKRRLTEMAKKQHLSLSELLRQLALGYLDRERDKIVPEVNRKLYFELGEISERMRDGESDPSVYIDLEKFLVRVRRELLGLDPLPDE